MVLDMGDHSESTLAYILVLDIGICIANQPWLMLSTEDSVVLEMG